MGELDIIGQFVVAGAAVIALITIGIAHADHRRSSEPGHWWLIALVSSFCLATVPTGVLGMDYYSPNLAYPWRIFAVGVVLVPGLAARVIRALCGARSRWLVASDVFTIAIFVYVLSMPTFPGGRYEPAPTSYLAAISMFAVAVIIAVTGAVVVLRRATVGQTGIVRTRALLLIYSLTTFGLAYVAWLVQPTLVVEFVVSVMLLLSGSLLFAGIRAPRRLLHWLHSGFSPNPPPALHMLASSTRIREQLPDLLRASSATWGFTGIAVLDGAGHPLEVIGASPAGELSARVTRELRITASGGDTTLIAWSTALTPPLRPADLDQLTLLVTLIQFAMDREIAESHERTAAADASAAARTLHVANRRLVEADELKDRFVALVSHELRTPLTSIIGLARTAESRWDDLTTEQLREFQSIIAQQGERLAQIVENLLLVSAIEAGALITTREPIDLRDSARTAVLDTGMVTADVEIDIPADSVWLLGQDRAISEILVNFLSNANKYGAPPIVVCARRAGTDIIVEVRDHGEGVNERFRDQLFERFTRDTASSNEIPGTGLGLSIVRDLARALGGDVGYRRGDGTSSFWMRIPASDAPLEDSAT